MKIKFFVCLLLIGGMFFSARGAYAQTGPSIDLKLDGKDGSGLEHIVEYKAPASFRLSWTATATMVNCRGSGAWTGTLSPNSSLQVTNKAAGTYKYTFECNNLANNNALFRDYVTAVVKSTASPQVRITLTNVNTFYRVKVYAKRKNPAGGDVLCFDMPAATSVVGQCANLYRGETYTFGVDIINPIGIGFLVLPRVSQDVPIPLGTTTPQVNFTRVLPTPTPGPQLTATAQLVLPPTVPLQKPDYPQHKVCTTSTGGTCWSFDSAGHIGPAVVTATGQSITRYLVPKAGWEAIKEEDGHSTGRGRFCIANGQACPPSIVNYPSNVNAITITLQPNLAITYGWTIAPVGCSPIWKAPGSPSPNAATVPPGDTQFRWNAVVGTGISGYAFRLDSGEPSWDADCSPLGAGDVCSLLTTTSTRYTTEVGKRYRWWVHAVKTNCTPHVYGPAVSFSFTATGPTPTPFVQVNFVNPQGQVAVFPQVCRGKFIPSTGGNSWVAPELCQSNVSTFRASFVGPGSRVQQGEHWGMSIKGSDYTNLVRNITYSTAGGTTTFTGNEYASSGWPYWSNGGRTINVVIATPTKGPPVYNIEASCTGATFKATNNRLTGWYRFKAQRMTSMTQPTPIPGTFVSDAWLMEQPASYTKTVIWNTTNNLLWSGAYKFDLVDDNSVVVMTKMVSLTCPTSAVVGTIRNGPNGPAVTTGGFKMRVTGAGILPNTSFDFFNGTTLERVLPRTGSDAIFTLEIPQGAPWRLGTGHHCTVSNDCLPILNPVGFRIKLQQNLYTMEWILTPIPSITPSRTPTMTPSRTPSPTRTPVPTRTPSPTRSPNDPTATVGPSPTDEPTPTDEPIPTEEPSPTDEPVPTDEITPTDDPGGSPSPTTVPGGNECPDTKFRGDANCDGNIDGVDFSIWLNSQCHPTSEAQVCSDTRANFDGDNNVDDTDYDIWLANQT